MDNSGLFRQKSLERISSPEDLHDYMRVTSPRLWMLLAAITALLIGFIVFAATANLENTIDIKVEVENLNSTAVDENGEPVIAGPNMLVYAALPLSYKDIVSAGMKIRIGKETGQIDMVAMVSPDNSGQELSLIIDMDNDSLSMKNGTYDAVLVLERTTPISFLWN